MIAVLASLGASVIGHVAAVGECSTVSAARGTTASGGTLRARNNPLASVCIVAGILGKISVHTLLAALVVRSEGAHLVGNT